jgi:ferredoxin-NADP reductase
MSSAALALLIATLILAQVGAGLALGYFRRRSELRALGSTGWAIPSGAVPLGGPEGGVPEAAPDDENGLIAATAAWPGFRDFVVRRRAVEDAAGTVCSFYLTPADGRPLPAYKPGQYLTFGVEIPDPAGGSPRTLVRCYSLSDCPSPDYYRVSIKRVPAPSGRPDLPGGVVSNHFHDRIEEGARLSARAPAGHFHLLEDGLPVVLLAGGIGITPLLAILNTLAQRGDPREVWLFYGVRNGSEQIMKGHLRALRQTHPRLHLHLCYSDPSEGEELGRDFQHRGRLDADLLRRTLPFGRYAFYLCGPPAMMESLVPALEDLGVSREDIHYESFGPASLNRRRGPSAPSSEDAERAIAVRFSRSGKTVPWDPSAESLLAFAEDQGIRVESGCRAGSCGCCQTAVESGSVEYLQTPDAEIAPGHCLLCIGKPAGDLTLAL